ncbi:glycoside-pentoside-hexuronide (GPH):cation symporter [Bifidobacterium sp. ESL0732]|uniref:glycoside-pentoside-hexuronide (GPH):cation symporter n=1 Tax=Bifidobacterium sp. ESL0732 TaxID=2983222 RepID=UPI0023F61FA3|nr:glycoside-pentoside-hexuronide (GPH):cation symporter [Bifidobacterium sp. ESL0732]WEV64360.1 glycoside-pentoside-hexuronide (GPH):cation symporter [Bifidobacterium sp. ESL0732]
MSKLKQSITYAFGAFGHDAFYAALTTYFITFVTSQLLETSNGGQVNTWLIGVITTLVVTIRIIEIFFDPFLGALVDNTHTRWGKFKPWIMGGAVISSIALVLIFSNFFGLTASHPMVYLVLFVIVFVIADFSYSVLDVAFWGLLPSLSLDSDSRASISSIARFGSTLGGTGVAVVLVPLNVWFSHVFAHTQGNEQTRAGWLGFAVVIAALSLIGALLTCWGTQEGKDDIRKNTQKTSFRDIFRIIGKNDQLMWTALAYLLFAFGFSTTNSMVVYYFRYVLGKPESYSLVGVVEAVLGILAVISFPTLQRLVTRKRVYLYSVAVEVVGYILFIFSGHSVVLALVATGICYVAQPLVFLVVLNTISDCVEYGQLKLGTRNESVTLTVRPLIDKLSGSFSTAIVSFAAVTAGMTGAATAADISNTGVAEFKGFMLYMPLVLIVISAIVFALKVTLTESKHDEIVKKLKARLEPETQASGDVSAAEPASDATASQTASVTTDSKSNAADESAEKNR